LNKKLLGLFLTLSCSFAEPAAVDAGNSSSYTWKIEWRMIDAGRATFNWKPQGVGQQGEGNLRVESTGMVARLYRILDVYKLQTDEQACPKEAMLNAQEGSKHRESTLRIEKDAQRIHFFEKDLTKNKVLNDKTLPIPGACVHDVPSAMMALRRMSLAAGESVQMPMTNGRKAAMVRIENQEKEKVKTPAGEFASVRYEAHIFNGNLYDRAARVHIWLTDDARKLPVQIRIKLPIYVGNITLQLEKTSAI
jgi:hypothetical protein